MSPYRIFLSALVLLSLGTSCRKELPITKSAERRLTLNYITSTSVGELYGSLLSSTATRRRHGWRQGCCALTYASLQAIVCASPPPTAATAPR